MLPGKAELLIVLKGYALDKKLCTEYYYYKLTLRSCIVAEVSSFY
jgi:hypothetical protein